MGGSSLDRETGLANGCFEWFRGFSFETIKAEIEGRRTAGFPNSYQHYYPQTLFTCPT